jgi:hypothetical protein
LSRFRPVDGLTVSSAVNLRVLLSNDQGLFMAKVSFSWPDFLLRLALALVLVFATYNPEGYSYYHWTITRLPQITVLQAFTGVVLVIGWVIFLRASFRSLGLFGILLAVAFFGTLLWLIVDMGWVSAKSPRAVAYLVLVAASGVLAAGISWSHVRRRITGQLDVDDAD